MILYKDVENKKSDIKRKLRDKEKLKEAKNNTIDNIFNGAQIVFTGKMKKTRTDMMVLAIKHGAEVHNNISKKTNYLVVGKNPGGKLDKAKSLGVGIIMEKEFWNLIQKHKSFIQFSIL